ncbi:MAG TPA: GvpL/GvpF family gas vesicle protein [Desulfobacteria bacterium]|nr:GvpL/GvpF family gas vesicle protein [Desulfobacteria bacterium]
MPKEGKYIYCIINGNEGRNFGPVGIGKRGDVVSTIGFQDISAVISSSPITQYVIDPENLTAHEKVIETVMKDYTVLPVRFCTIANSAEEVRTFLRRQYGEFKGMLHDFDNKVEMGLKARWTRMDSVFEKIGQNNPEVKELRKSIAGRGSDVNNDEKVSLGKVVKGALEEQKKATAEKILHRFKRLTLDTRENDLVVDDMFLNAVFLIDRTREKQFDFLVEDLAEEYQSEADFKLVGPAPPFNFVSIEMKLK